MPRRRKGEEGGDGELHSITPITLPILSNSKTKTLFVVCESVGSRIPDIKVLRSLRTKAREPTLPTANYGKPTHLLIGAGG